uniref:hypothetical protein n=1 Tax=Ruminococcus sp. TaxID=41978 RepID=UPI00386F3AE6
MVLKRTLSIFLAILMIGMTFTAFPITVNAVDVDAAGTSDVDPENIYPVSDSRGMSDAEAKIREKGAGEYVIELDGNIDNGAGISFKGEGVKVTIIGNGHYFHCPAGQNVQAWEGATVILGDGVSELTLKGGITNDNPGVVYVIGEKSRCEMNDGVTIKDNQTNAYFGGGVSVVSGTFIMNGGTIENCGVVGGSLCYGGGVGVTCGGNFTMNGGTIKDCFVENDSDNSSDYLRPSTAGGGVFICRADFTMNRGSIKDCWVYSDKISASGGGVAVVNSKQSIKDNNNKLGYSDSNFTMNGGEITGCDGYIGGGALVFGLANDDIGSMLTPIGEEYEQAAGSSNPGLFLNGGKMEGNSASYGGAIFISTIRETIPVNIKNMNITSNEAAYGGGIAVFSFWTNSYIDNCRIIDNSAVRNGGGVYLSNNGDGGKTSLKDTTITGNKSGDRGAGVYYDEESKLYISGANNIQNNTFNGVLNNLNVLSVEKPVYVNGALSGSKIGLSDPRLWDDSKEDAAPDAVSADKLTSGYRAYNLEIHPSEYFTSDHETWVVDRSVKTVIEEPDEASAYRVYTVERHPLEDNTTPNVYANNKGQYIILKTQNDTSGITNANTLFTALRNYYSNSEYYDVNPNYNFTNDVRFLPKDSNAPLSYVQLKKNNYGDITVTYSAARAKRQYIGSISCSASISNQRYAKEKELVLQITKSDTSDWFNKYQNLSNLYFKTDYTEEKIEYVNADPPGGVLYEYDEYGDIKAKLIVSSSYEPKYSRSTTIESGTDDEVRLVRKKPDYHINNTEIDDNYNNNDIFTPYVEAATKEIKVGDTIERFYTVPEVVPTDTNSCPYIFKGWYYDQDNDNDSHPVKFGTDKYAKDIYAHWIKVENVDKDADDPSILPGGGNTYGGFDLAGVQIRKEMRDYNFDDVPKKPGGMRFITSLSMDVVKQINAIQPNNIEYGYVAATHEGWIEYHSEGVAQGLDEKLKYVSDKANGINTTKTTEKGEDYFGFAHNVNCTSRQTNKNGIVRLDHQNFGNYLLYSFVVTYEGEDAARKDTNVLARPYIHYTDANGLERV